LKKLGKYFLITLTAIILLLVGTLLSLRLPFVQQKITNYATSYMEGETGATLKIDRLFVTFLGAAQLEGIYIEDQQKDTLLYSKSIVVDVAWAPLLDGYFAVKNVAIAGLYANIHNKTADSSFNYQFIIDAFAAPDSIVSKQENSSKQPKSDLLPFNISKISLNKISLRYADTSTEMETMLDLQELSAAIDSLNFDLPLYKLKNFTLNGLTLNYKQGKPFPATTDSSSSSLPIVLIDQLALSKINVSYESMADSLFLRSKIDRLGLVEGALDLHNQTFSGRSFIFNAPLFDLQLAATDSSSSQAEEKNHAPNSFSWPEWRVNLKNIDFQMKKLVVDQGIAVQNTSNIFDPEHLHFKDLSLKTKTLKLAHHEILIDQFVSSLSTKENDFELKRLQANLHMNDSSLIVEKLLIQTKKSFFECSQELYYSSLDRLLAVDFSDFRAKLEVKAGTSLDLTEAYFFAPYLKNESLFDSIAQEKIKLYGLISGNTTQLNFQDLYMLYGGQSSLHAKGVVNNWLAPDKLALALKSFTLNLVLADFSYLKPDSYLDSYPQQIKLVGAASYGKNKVKMTISGMLDQLSTLKLDASYSLNTPNDYHINFIGNKLALDKWLQDSVLFSTIDLGVDADGQGVELASLYSNVTVKAANFKYRGQPFDTLSINAEIKNGLFTLDSKYSDDRLRYTLNAGGSLDSTTQKINLNLQLEQLDLLAFNITDSLAYLKTGLSANAVIDSLAQYVSFELDQLSYADQHNYFDLAPVKLELVNGVDSSRINFSWEEIALKLHLNQPLTALANAQLSQERLLALDLFKIDTAYGPVNLDFMVNATLSKDLSALLDGKLDFDPLNLQASYTGLDKKLALDFQVPRLRYEELFVDSLTIFIKADTNHLQLTNHIKKIESGFLNIFSTEINATVAPKTASLNLKMKDELGDNLFLVHADATSESDSLLWKIDTEKLILNGEKWALDEKNCFFVAKDHVLIRSMAFQSNNERIFIETTEEDKLHGLHVNFTDFNLGNLLAILNPEERLLDGILNGDFTLADLNNPLDFRAEIALKDMVILNEPAGNMALSTSQVAVDSYVIDLRTDGPVKLNGKAKVDLGSETSSFDVKLFLEELSLSFVTVFTEGIIQDAEGVLSGEFSVKGSPDDFSYTGELRFKEAKLFITELNTSFSLPDELILLNEQTIKLQNFTILDGQSHKMLLNGSIKTDEILNPQLDLQLKADDFQLMNKENIKDAQYYGTVFIDAETDIKGRLLEPIIRANLKINKATDFTFVVPPSTIDIVQMEGIVQFKNPYEALDSLQNKSDSSLKSIDVSGIDLSALIKTDKEAQFKVVIDKNRGDYLIVSGESDLNLELDKNGDVNLTGNYLVNNGYYQLSLYDLVKRKFEISSGSQVKWYGDPLEAGLSITANYNLETSPNSLMAGQNVSTRKLAFIVELFINGSLSAPEISFGLNMPEEAKGALGGRVYQQVQAINNNETELNKQVFSLLVLNQFFPAGSTGDGPDSEVLARNSASQILTNQLNKLSDQYIKGVDLNLDLDSYKATENGAAAQRTQLGLSLSKSLFDDRFKVQVGSQFELEGEQRSKQSASDILGNILIEYLLTEDGRYKLTGYRKNEYEGLIDGQVTLTGISVQFNKEFENFSELLNAPKNNLNED
jgi:hypothetical protein